jgi:hypothetical protein
MTKVGWYAISKSTTLESNKSLQASVLAGSTSLLTLCAYC